MPAQLASLRFCAQWFMTFRVAGSGEGVFYNVLFQRGEGPSCTCPSFQRRTGWRDVRECKHTRRVMAEACLWNEQWYDGGDRSRVPVEGSLRSNPVEGDSCPACGGPVVKVLCAV